MYKGVYLVQALPGVGKSTLGTKFPGVIVDLEDSVGPDKYSSLNGQDMLASIDSVIAENEELEFITSALWFDKAGLKPDLVIGVNPANYNGDFGENRGREGFGTEIKDEEFHDWAMDVQNVVTAYDLNYIELGPDDYITGPDQLKMLIQ